MHVLSKAIVLTLAPAPLNSPVTPPLARELEKILYKVDVDALFPERDI
jgi:hypothetical protein